MGLSAISFTEMQAFFELNAIDPEPCDVQLLEMFDRTAMNLLNEQQRKKDQIVKAKAASKGKK